MQNTTECYRYFLRVSSRTTYYERVTTLIVIMVVFSKKTHTKPELNNMVLVKRDSSKGSLRNAP